MKTAEQVVNEINSARGDGDEQGLRNTAALLELLRAWPECPVIHVAGTNGKGSVCAMLSGILTAAGYRTGLYTSPFLQEYRERVRINGTPVSNEQLEKYGGAVLDAAEKLRAEKGYRNTPFELGTALAFHAFREEGVQAVVCETGLGGRLDPTNVIPKPAVCAVTAVGMDHMQILGGTIREIAAEKAGIIKPGVPVVCSPQENTGAAEVLARSAAEKGAPLTMLGREQVTVRESTAEYSVIDARTDSRVYEGLRLSLPGAHQAYNALTALAAAEELRKQGLRISEEAVRQGLGHTFWPGRLEWHGNMLMDGAHNEQGAAAFRRFTEEHLAGRKKVLLAGVLEEKLTEGMLRELSADEDTAITVTPDSPRAMKAETLAGLLSRKGMEARAANSLKEGLALARQAAGDEGVVLATGSLYFIGALRSELGLRP